MKWVYGKQDWKTFERGQENCYLMTNGLGGFSSMTMTGSATRNDHAFLMACMKAPNNRYNVIHRLAERVEADGKEYPLSSQEFADGTREEGYRYLSSFSYEDTPIWRFLVNGIEIEKEAAMRQGENTAAVIYRVRNRSGKDIRFTVTPFVQFVPKGSDMEERQVLRFEADRIESGGLTLSIRTDGEAEKITEKEETYFYSYDACDGRRSTGKAKAGCRISAGVKAGGYRELGVVFSVCGADDRMTGQEMTAWQIIEEQKACRKELEERAGFSSDMAVCLAKSASQFIAKRESTGGDTILAGFPFFEDWGRDTMIALPGVCLSTRRYDEARSILRTFARYEKDALMPNLFPEGGEEPMYNTVDAALLFINCVWLYYDATEDLAFVEEMYPVMERILEGYRKGTRFGIHMDEDGLIMAGEGLDQVTWMDVRVGEILPTPRHGKPVEVNAYWYNALCIMAAFSRKRGGDGAEYERLAEKVRGSFAEAFWMEEKHCLKDVISGTDADTQIRCNQIWAISMPFTMLDPERERQVVDTVFEKLYTPYGLRTLSQDDPQFRPSYGGEVLERDLAYHQGTVWAYPLGAYYLAYLKVNGRMQVRIQVKTVKTAIAKSVVLESFFSSNFKSRSIVSHPFAFILSAFWGKHKVMGTNGGFRGMKSSKTPVNHFYETSAPIVR